MRICGGQFRGRKLNTPTSDHIRPTSDKVRQALFNMLESRDLVKERTVLDGFCGTGALGLEALSRGAGHVVFMDKDRRSIKTCKDNAEMLSVQSQADIFCHDTTKFKLRPESVCSSDLVFLDPPYHKDFIPQAIESLESGGWVRENAVYVLESEKQFELMKTGFTLLQEKIYKDTKIMIVEKRSNDH